MSSKKIDHRKASNNVVVFPYTIEHHLGKAIKAGNQKDYREALRHYEQILKYDPNHTSGKIGMAVTWIEMNHLQDAIDLTADMLEKGDGDYYHILRIHIAALLQSEQYTRLNRILHQVLARPDVPDEIRIECESIAEACSVVEGVDVADESDPIDSIRRQRANANPAQIQSWIKQMYEGSLEQQFIALEQLQYVEDDKAGEAVREWLNTDEEDPLLKTLGLKALSRMGQQGKITFRKNGKSMEANLSQIPTCINEFPPPVIRVIQCVENTADQDPTLLEFSSRIWMEYLYTVFPEIPDIDRSELWAAALHYITGQKLYEEMDVASIYSMYRIIEETGHKEVEYLINHLQKVLFSRHSL